MNLYEYQRSMSFIDLGPRSLRFNIFKLLFLRNSWSDWSQISCGSSMDEGTKACSNGPGHMTKMAAMPIFGKNMKNSSLEPKGWCLKSWYAASGSWVPSSLFKWWFWFDLDLFMAWSNLVPYAFVWEEGKRMDFSETVVVYDVKLGRCSQLSEYMKLMSTKGQGHSLILVQISQIQYF